MTKNVPDEDKELVEHHQETLCQFKSEICERSTDVDPSGQMDWYDLSVGWFIAKGVTVEDAKRLACLARYTYQYWM